MTSAFVHCRGGRVMEFKFEDDADPDVMFHTSRYGIRYSLTSDADILQPIWVGRFIPRDGNAPGCWVTVMGILRVVKIVLPLGQVYYPNGGPCER